MQRPPIPSPISILPFNTTHSIYSLRATADASTPSTSSIDTPVHDRFVVQPTPMTADESCRGQTYSGQACQCMPLDSLHSEYSKPYPNGDGAICEYQVPPSALLSQYSQHPSLAFPHVFVPSTCHAHSFSLAQASHVHPQPPLMHHHQHSETTMNVYDLSTSTQTSMTVFQSSVNACAALAPDPCHSYAQTHYAPHNPPIVRSRLTSNGWQPPNTSSCHPFPSYVAPAPLPTSPVPSVPLHHPKPVHPLPEWTKKPSLVLDEFFCEESLNTDSSAILAHAVPPMQSGPDASSFGEYWDYGQPIANATIDRQDSSRNGDDEYYDDFDDEEDDEFYDDEDADMEEDFEMGEFPGIDPAMPAFHATPSDHPAPFCGTLSSAAVPLSSSSLLCQPLPDFVQNQFRASAV